MMASSAARTIRAVKPHIPLIKFPSRKGPDGAKSQSAFKETGTMTASTSTSSKPIGSTARGSGIDGIDLPTRYHRKPLTTEEMEVIERGGSL